MKEEDNAIPFNQNTKDSSQENPLKVLHDVDPSQMAPDARFSSLVEVMTTYRQKMADSDLSEEEEDELTDSMEEFIDWLNPTDDEREAAEKAANEKIAAEAKAGEDKQDN
jgi:uncharacterized membrane protein YukC